MRNYIVYNGKRSDDFGVNISGDKTFTAPVRDMEAIAIPGKNGHMLLDNGRYENITVVYPAYMGKDFDKRIGEFRSFVASNPGYHRLEDSYHPDEYRLAAFRSGLEPETGVLNKNGRFDLTFDCRPERYLKSGERWTEEVMPCGSIGHYVDGGAGVAAPSFMQTPYIQMSGAFTASLVATPKPGHSLSELSTALVDDTLYAIYYYRITGTGTSYVQTTADILSSLVSTGHYDVSVASGNQIYFSIKTVEGFSFAVTVNGTTYPLTRTLTIYNPTRYPAKPLIRVMTAAGATAAHGAEFTLGGITVSVAGGYPYGHIMIDCDLGDAYYIDYADGNKVYNANGYISLKDDAGNVVHEFPELDPGLCNVYFASESSWLTVFSMFTVSLQPRWWTL